MEQKRPFGLLCFPHSLPSSHTPPLPNLTSIFLKKLHLPFMPTLPSPSTSNPLSIHLSSSSWFIMPVTQSGYHSAAESSMPFAGHQQCLCLRGTLLPAGLGMLVAISTLKFDCCKEMKAISYHTPRRAQKWILPLFYSQPGSSPFFKGCWTPI